MKVSIVIPTYNVEKYIARCLDSVINQTLKEIEIIVVDDKSTDNTLSIVKDYASRDNRIKVIELFENQGVSVARNTGIDLSTGEYIGFIDPDDYVDLDFYEKLYARTKDSDADIISGNIIGVMFNNEERKYDYLMERLRQSKYWFNYTLWHSIYKSSFIKENKIYNPVGVITSQDTVFCIKCACLANRIEVVPDTYYHYIRVHDSLSSVILSEKKIKSKIQAMELIIDFVNKQNLQESDYNSLLISFFEFMSTNAFYRNTKRETKTLLVNAAIDFYNKYKYKNAIRKRFKYIYPYLESNDADGLYKHNEEFKDEVLSWKINLLGKIPFIKIKKYVFENKVRVSLFGLTIFIIKKIKKDKFNG